MSDVPGIPPELPGLPGREMPGDVPPAPQPDMPPSPVEFPTEPVPGHMPNEEPPPLVA